MRMKRIEIENFRIYGSKKVFKPNNPLILIGENDSGKSTLSYALEIFFSNYNIPHKKKDFHKLDTSKNILIAITFTDLSFKFKKKFNEYIANEEIIIVKEYGYNEELKKFKKVITYFKYEDFKSDALHGNELRVLQHFLSEHIIIPAERRLSTEARLKGSNLMRRLLDPLIDDASQQIKCFKKQALLTIKAEVQKRTKNLKQILLEANPTIQDLNVNPDIDFTKGIDLNFEVIDNINELPIPIEEKASSSKSSFIMALFKLYAKEGINSDKDYIFSFEEPEIYLHPRAQRELLNALKDVAAQGNQVFIITNSTIFVDQENIENITVFRRLEDNYDIKVISLEENKNMLSNIIEEINLKNSDFLFAEKILLVEGKTELEALPIFLEDRGVDFCNNGIKIMNLNRDDILDETFLNLCNDLGIEIMLLLNSDSKDRINELVNYNYIDKSLIISYRNGGFEDLFNRALIVKSFKKIYSEHEEVQNADFTDFLNINKYNTIDDLELFLDESRLSKKGFRLDRSELGKEIGKTYCQKNYRIVSVESIIDKIINFFTS
ncbi:ATP-dependent nuclease [Selenihalanaerobacter shriftii]|uniref:Predicted ATP-dependent endonuclease of the OLD family, contains P-loop ATPase and TOPRIM domains n=1 Tax=Selenihalanaerobacter shriftii TaxID=142842 RepID=A0A1T4LKD2_9FIRM|nr:AAA family ATPase [Selenihalanaerobacter shriftii]SJZ55200.1 Predicted ATP-dependent endonuclease of the OLD family, contains P-loop ATPase and TOPRIM domains [Selenihalanaerobacter shriftii]